jgi:uncharacterized protein YecE (DUF72 family)
MANFYIGTSGFSHDDWKGAFYPPGMTGKAFLEFHANDYNARELNFSYYRMPEEGQVRQMLAKSRERLHFMIRPIGK